MSGPTPFADLNGVLARLVDEVRAVLRDDLVGVYLQGSFAVGDADEHSDVDFLVVTRTELSAAQVAALQEVHPRLYAIDVPWARHLEGSYVPAQALRRVDPSRAPYWYLDNGATQLVLSDHCNTAVVRWSLRERGVVLAGPPPATLVDPVPAERLRAEVAAAADEWLAWAREPQERFAGSGMSRWKQALLVLSFCRILHTLEIGEVTSKRQAGEWALGALDERWVPLVRRALDDRPDPWGRVHQEAEADVVRESLAFADYAMGEVRRRTARDG